MLEIFLPEEKAMNASSMRSCVIPTNPKDPHNCRCFVAHATMRIEVMGMREQKFYLYFDSIERTILLHSLVALKNHLIEQGRYTDCVDELIIKVAHARVKKVKIS